MKNSIIQSEIGYFCEEGDSEDINQEEEIRGQLTPQEVK